MAEVTVVGALGSRPPIQLDLGFAYNREYTRRIQRDVDGLIKQLVAMKVSKKTIENIVGLVMDEVPEYQDYIPDAHY